MYILRITVWQKSYCIYPAGPIISCSIIYTVCLHIYHTVWLNIYVSVVLFLCYNSCFMCKSVWCVGHMGFEISEMACRCGFAVVTHCLYTVNTSHHISSYRPVYLSTNLRSSRSVKYSDIQGDNMSGCVSAPCVLTTAFWHFSCRCAVIFSPPAAFAPLYWSSRKASEGLSIEKNTDEKERVEGTVIYVVWFFNWKKAILLNS